MRRALALAAAALLLLAAPATAKQSFNDLEDEVMCVTCNVPLNIAESPQADQERDALRRLIDAGLTKQQIFDAMVEKYGANVLAEPKGGGFDIVAWLVPIGAALALAALGLLLLPRWRRRDRGDDGDGPAAPPLDPADAARVDADMARLGV